MTVSKKIYRWGLLGTGRMAAEFTEELRLHKNAVPAAAASSLPGRAHVFARNLDIPHAFDSYEALLACDGLDVIYIAGTHDTHFPYAMRCIERRLPVLVEKPICTRLSDLEALRAAATANRVFCMEAMWMLFFPSIRGLKQTLAKLGPVRRLDASFCIDIPFDPNHRLYNPALAGSAMLDIGIYPVTFALHLFGTFPEAFDSRLTLSLTGTDSAGEIDLRYADGSAAHLVYSLDGHSPHRAEIVCEGGRVVLEDFFHPSRMTVYSNGHPPAAQSFSYPFKGYNYEIDAVHDALEAGLTESDIMPLQTSAQILSTMEKILNGRKKMR